MPGDFCTETRGKDSKRVSWSANAKSKTRKRVAGSWKIARDFVLEQGRRECCGSAKRPNTPPKGSKYHYSSYLAGFWALKVYTILLLGPFGPGVNVDTSAKLRPWFTDPATHTRDARFSSPGGG